MNETTVPLGRPLKVLVVDDTATNRQIVQVFLKKLGHQVVLAEDGAQAVACFEREAPDLVLMDVMMPVMDGYEATRQIKQLCGDRWTPVVFLSALDKEENLVAGLNAGGDDYLPKPLNFVILQAKLRSLTRAIDTHRHLGEANNRLRAYHEAQESENRLAAEILMRQFKRDGLDDPAVHHWILPAAQVSGDVIGAARAPTGELCIMLADATGHGLAASISTVPVLALFYELVFWGVKLEVIVTRINKQLQQGLPPSRFVAAALLMINEQTCTGQAWIGGVPPVLLLRPDGVVERSLESAGLPLGIVDFDEEMARTEHFAWTPGSQLALYSDGLLEAENAAGEGFGLASIEAAFAASSPGRRIDAVRQALQRHLDDQDPHDDITLMLVDCRSS